MEHNKDNVKYSATFLFIKGRVGDLVQNIFVMLIGILFTSH